MEACAANTEGTAPKTAPTSAAPQLLCYGFSHYRFHQKLQRLYMGQPLTDKKQMNQEKVSQ